MLRPSTVPFRKVSLVLLTILGSMVAGLWADRSQIQAATAIAGKGDVAGLVEIGGGRRMYLECQGLGGPTVILISGYGNDGDVWNLSSPDLPQPQVLPTVAGFTRVCTYDRPGTTSALDFADHSRTDPVPQPRTAQQAVADLHALLRAAAVPGPYVLVGHSLGGLYARLYASTYPDEVVGMVLIDAISERLRAALTPEQWAITREITQQVPPELASWQDYERVDFDAIFDEMIQAAAARPLQPMPLVVLSAGVVADVSEAGQDLPPGFQEALVAAQQASQAFLAGLLSDARHTLVPDSSHYIQVERPQVVIDAIRQVVDTVRGRK